MAQILTEMTSSVMQTLLDDYTIFRNDSENANTFINCANAATATKTYAGTNVRNVIAIGASAAANGEYLNDCVYIGIESGRDNLGASGDGNTLVGNTAVGRLTLAEGTHPTNCTAFGDSCLRRAEAGASGSCAFGYVTLEYLTTGQFCNAFGGAASQLQTTGSHVNSFGNGAGYAGTTGSRNNWFGHYCGQANIASNDNSGFGHFSLFNLTGHANTTGENTGIGVNAGFYLTAAYRNTFVGANAGNNVLQKVDAANSMSLGYLTYTTKDNQVVIGNSSVVETLLRGDVIWNPGSSITLDTNGTMTIEATSNTAARLKYRGSDGTTRYIEFTLST